MVIIIYYYDYIFKSQKLTTYIDPILFEYILVEEILKLKKLYFDHTYVII